MQKALKEDEEMELWFGAGAERIRVFEIYPAHVEAGGADRSR